VNRYLLQTLEKWIDISRWHHHGEWFTTLSNRSRIHKVNNKWFSHAPQGRGNSQLSLHPTTLLHAPTDHSKALVKLHRSSLECCDDIKIINTAPQEVYFPCPWRHQYELIPTKMYHWSMPNILTMIPTNQFPYKNQICKRWIGLTRSGLSRLADCKLGFGATDGRIEDVSSYRAEICRNVTTFTSFNLIRKVYVFSTPSIEHVCNNKSAINATWKDENISIFNKMKPDAGIAKFARNAIADIQQHSQVSAFWVEGHADKCGPPLSTQE
jgi:hypothetical protein